MAEESESIFREVDEEVRRDRVIALAKRHGPRLAAGMLIAIVGTAAYWLWDERREARLRDEAEIFAEALAAGDAEAFAETAARLEGGHRHLARLRQAAALLEGGNPAAAIPIYDRVAADASDARLAAFAAYLAAAAALEVEGPDAAIARLEPLATPGAPLRFSALELIGVAYLRLGDIETASSRFAAIAEDPQAPNALKTRAGEVLTGLEGQEGGAPK